MPPTENILTEPDRCEECGGDWRVDPRSGICAACVEDGRDSYAEDRRNDD